MVGMNLRHLKSEKWNGHIVKFEKTDESVVSDEGVEAITIINDKRISNFGDTKKEAFERLKVDLRIEKNRRNF